VTYATSIFRETMSHVDQIAAEIRAEVPGASLTHDV